MLSYKLLNRIVVTALTPKTRISMNKKITFYLARHGQTVWNIEKRLQGQLDSPLTKLGKSQSLLLAQQCLPLHITHVLTSLLGRSVQTATICSELLGVHKTKITDFNERNFGVWQGELTEEVKLHPDYAEITSQVTDCRPVQGESALSLLSRFENALKDQLESAGNETYLVITHGDVLRCFMDKFNKKGALTTGYDYKNAQLISLYYDLERKVFSLL